MYAHLKETFINLFDDPKNVSQKIFSRMILVGWILWPGKIFSNIAPNVKF